MRTTSLASLALVALVVVGCGGGSDGSSGGVADPGGTVAGDPGGADPGPAVGVNFDVSALSTAPITGSITRGGAAGSSVAAVIDTCAALSADRVSAIAGEVDAEFSFGSTFEFSAEGDGARCIYRSDTHAISIIVGDGATVTADPGNGVLGLPIASGDVSATPWSTDSAVTIFSEDSFGIDTSFAAHAAAGDLGVIVSNGAGTGIDASSSGELWARIAAAAAEGTSGAPRVEAGEASPSVTDPCEVWTIEEIDGFFPDRSVSTDDDVTTSRGCVWTGPNFDVEAGINVEPIEGRIEYEGGVPVADGSSVLMNPEYGNPYVVNGDNAISVDVRVDQRSEIEAAIALAENIAARLG